MLSGDCPGTDPGHGYISILVEDPSATPDALPCIAAGRDVISSPRVVVVQTQAQMHTLSSNVMAAC